MALNVLAVLGIAAAAWHMVRAAFRFLREGATGIWAGALARTHARRGDLTSMQERRRERADAGRSGSWQGVVALAWLVVLLAPMLTPWSRALYAGCALLWVPTLLQGSR